MACEQGIALLVHASTPAGPVYGLCGQVRAETPGRLRLQYWLEADLSRLRVPRAGAGRRLDELWKHTCFEAFIASSGTAAYHEFNFSPSRDWAVYRFMGYRERMEPVPLADAPQIEVHQEEGRLRLDCSVAWLAPGGSRPAQAPLRVALAAVIEADDGRLSYWALRHPPGKPDFHHPDAFALELALSTTPL